MVLSKGLYRVAGTLVGCLASIVLIALFAQTPELFILALALWIGLCTLCANLLTNFRSYAAVLAGYTTGIVSLATIEQPTTIFDVAMARGSCILIAIACSMIVTSIFSPHRSREEALAGLKQVIVKAARRAAFPWNGDHARRLAIGSDLIQHLIQLHTLVEFAAAESGTFRLHRARANSLLVHLFGVISAKRSLDAHVQRCGVPADPALIAARDECFAFLGSVDDKVGAERMPDIVRQIDILRQHLAMLDPEGESLPPEELVSRRVFIDRLDDILAEFGAATEDWIDLDGPHIPRPPLSLNFHRDHRAAMINALRAAATIGAAGTFWVASAWPTGPNALVFAGIICTLFSTVPQPDRVGWMFFHGSWVAALAAFVCTFFVLNSVANFEGGRRGLRALSGAVRRADVLPEDERLRGGLRHHFPHAHRAGQSHDLRRRRLCEQCHRLPGGMPGRHPRLSTSVSAVASGRPALCRPPHPPEHPGDGPQPVLPFDGKLDDAHLRPGESAL